MKTKLRDKVAWALANFILNTVASKRYRDNLDTAIKLGLIKWEEVVKEERK